MTTNPDDVDLTNCDREPIHIPGSIQSSGWLIACDAECVRILRHSRGAARFFDKSKPELIGTDLVSVLGPKLVHDIRNALSTSIEPSRPGLLFGRELACGKKVDIATHRHNGTVIIEFEPSPTSVQESPLDLTRMLVGRLRRAKTEGELVRNTAHLLRGVLGFDRVMVYGFAHDGSGRVLSEAKGPGLETFLGQHFPASDIPQQARRLYLQNTIRIIADAGGERVPIIPELDASGEPLDLSFAHLRSVSAIHCEYLRNMGVHASMSISIIVEGALWGLIACHHYAPHRLSMTQRVAAETFGEFFSLHLEALLHQDRLASAVRTRNVLDNLLRDLTDVADLQSTLVSRIDSFSTLIPADGVAIWLNRRWTALGETPPMEAAIELERFVEAMSEGGVYATHTLSQHLPSAAAYKAKVSGLLAIPLSQRPRDYVYFFRKELVQTIDWAGDPKKHYESGPFGDRLTPRKSFALWRQTVEGQSARWSKADRSMAETARTSLVEVVLRGSEALQEVRTKAEVRQRILNDELSHRVKNILSLIKSLVSQPVPGARSLRDYVSALQGRIQALSYAHDQIVRGSGGGSLRAMLIAEISPYQTSSEKITVQGPDLILDARAFSVMALVLHELTTNAAKYGALSCGDGRLGIKWREVTGGCEVNWVETGVVISKKPTRVGFGTTLIERSIPFDLGGESQIDYISTGLQGRFFIPSHHFALLPEDDAGPGDEMTELEADPSSGSFAGLRVLLLEDQMLIALDAESLLLNGGALEVITCNSVSDAKTRLQVTEPDIAILDLNLGSDLSLPVATRLVELRIPFVFATGYGDTALIPEALGWVPIVRKPYDFAGLARAIATVRRRTLAAGS